MNRMHQLILLVAVTILAWPIASSAHAGAALVRSDGPLVLAGTTPGTSVSSESAGAKTAPKDAPANIMIPDPQFTFDPVVDGSEVVHDFRVYNRGKGDLVIEKVQTG